MTDDAVTETLRRAIALHQAGQLQAAEQLYRSILQIQPEQPDVHHNLGLLALQFRKAEIALRHLKMALTVNPAQGKYWHSYIQALMDSGRYVEARQVLQQGKKEMGLHGTAIDELSQRLAQPSVEAARQLLEAFNQRRYAEAEVLAQSLVAQFPGYGFAWKVLGLCFQERQQMPEAFAAMARACELSPDDAQAFSNYASALHNQGLLPEAIDYYRRVLRIAPGNAAVHSNLGVIFHNLGRYAEAESCLLKVLALTPADVAALINLGLIYQAQNRASEAERCFLRAIECNPHSAPAHHYLSIALKIQGRVAEAETSSRQALSLNPNFAEAHSNLGAIRYEQGLYLEAQQCFAEALRCRADYPEALNNLGTLQQMQRQLAQAESSFRKAIALNPGFAEAHTNLGINLQSQGRAEEAESCWRTSLQLNPDQITTQSGLVFHLTYSAREPTDYLEEALKYGRMVADNAAGRFTAWTCVNTPRRLRIGLVSGDLRNHPVGHFLHGLLRHIDKERVEFVAYTTQPGTDEFSARIQSYFAGWKTIAGLSDEAAAQLIHADGIHILFDVSGHSSHNRLPLFAWKPAPIQVSWLGYLGSTGVEAIDYVLSDPYSIRTQDESHFSEAIWRLPDSCICFTPTEPVVDIAPLPALSQGFVTFGSFNNPPKMGEAVVALWSRVLHEVPNSRLFLKAGQFAEPAIRDRTLRRFASHGIAEDRLLLTVTVADRSEHLATYHQIDIALDTFPYPGVTTSVEALWMGVPVLTLQGDGILARAGEAININAGLPEWIAKDESDYVAKAAAFSANLAGLSQLRDRLRSQVTASPLFDSVGFAKQFEEAVWGMWEKRNTQQES